MTVITQSPAFDDLKKQLAKMFQLDRADLDFGIYRIMNHKRDEIINFLDKDLLPQVQQSLDEYQSTDLTKIKTELEQLTKSLQDAGVDPNSSQKVQNYKTQLAEYDTGKLETEIYSDLYNFFKRYYSEGDFLSLRRYKEGVYALPYEGEEVKLHWANHDQYYIKTSEDLKNYIFKLPSGRRVRFELASASIEKDNNKALEGKDRRFVLHEEDSFETKEDELVIRFEYKVIGAKTSQKDLTEQALSTILASKDLKDWTKELATLVPTDKNKDRTLLAKHLETYTAKHQFDYFIHKDLGKFLRRELDFYIKNEIMHLDDIEDADSTQVEMYLGKIKILRKIAGKIIKFLAQLEDFQKKLWLKKKFVLETNYCLTLDKIINAEDQKLASELLEEISKNETQVDEWINLFAIDELKNFKKPLSVDFLKANDKLLLDTKFFDKEFKFKVLSMFESIISLCKSALFNSDNFHALNILSQTHSNAIDVIYIDPPYNTGEDGFIYKDNYKHSSWLSMFENRLFLAASLSRSDSCLGVSINEEELFNLKQLMDLERDYLTTITVKVRHEDRILKGDKEIHETTEQLLLYKNKDFKIAKRILDNTSIEDYEWSINELAPPESSVDMGGKRVDIFSPHQFELVKTTANKNGLKRINIRGGLREGNSSGRFYVANIEPMFDMYRGCLFKVENIGKDNLGHRYFFLPEVSSSRKNGDYFQGIPVDKKDTKEIPYPNHWNVEPQYWDLEKEFNRCSNEGGTRFRNGKKPVKFIKKFLEISGLANNSNAIMLDYFAGSGSCQSPKI